MTSEMMEEEISDKFLFERGGAWIGFYGASGPLASLSGDQNALCISIAGESIAFTRDRIVALRMYRGLLSGSLYIEHAVPTHARRVKFAFPINPGSPRFMQIKEKLEALGYIVSLHETVLMQICSFLGRRPGKGA